MSNCLLFYSSLSICKPSFRILASILSEKALIQIFNVNMQNRDTKMGKYGKIKAMSSSLNPIIQSLILHMYAIFEDCRLHRS